MLAILVDDYERTCWPTERVDPVDAIKAYIEMNGLEQSDLSKLFGSISRASEILNRRRRLTVEMISKLVNEWGIPADWLVQSYELAVKAETGKQYADQRSLRKEFVFSMLKKRAYRGKGFKAGGVPRSKKAVGAGG